MRIGRLRRDALLESRRAVLGTRSPQCSVPGCTERDPRSLTGTHPAIVCAEHRAIEAGRSWLEAHHVAGQRNDPTTVELPANWHAAMTHEQQTAWPRDLLRNPESNPLLATQARVRGSRETIGVILERPLAEAEAELDRVRRFLDEHHPGWVDGYRAWLTEADRVR